MGATVFQLRRSSFAFCCLFAATALAQDGSPQLSLDQQVPVELRTAVRGAVSQLAPALAKHGITAGIVRLRDEVAPATPGIVTSHGAGRVTLRRVLELFQEVHPRYQASVSNGVVRIRPYQATSCDAALDTQIQAMDLSGTDVNVVTRLVELSSVKRGQRTLGGAVGSTVSRPGEVPRTAGSPLIATRLGPSSLESALDTVALAVRGSVWMASEGTGENGRTNCYMTLFRSDGTAVVFGVDLSR